NIGDRAVGDPPLGAVEYPAFIRAAGTRFHGAGIGTVIGFGEAEAADLVTRRQRGQPPAPLLFRAESKDRVHDQRPLHADEASQAAVAALQFLHHQAIRDIIHVGAAVLFGEIAPEQAHLGHVGYQFTRESGLFKVLIDYRNHTLVDE